MRISPARARLLKALLGSAPDAQLFAVGDDWQAIYRFGGSDIAVMREFETWFGDYLRINVETMFRTDDRIAKVATDFVLRNPAQIRKTVRPMRKADRRHRSPGNCCTDDTARTYSAGCRKLTCPVRNARRDAWSAAKIRGAEVPSTAVPTGRIAGSRDRRVQVAGLGWR